MRLSTKLIAGHNAAQAFGSTSLINIHLHNCVHDTSYFGNWYINLTANIYCTILKPAHCQKIFFQLSHLSLAHLSHASFYAFTFAVALLYADVTLSRRCYPMDTQLSRPNTLPMFGSVGKNIAKLRDICEPIVINYLHRDQLQDPLQNLWHATTFLKELQKGYIRVPIGDQHPGSVTRPLIIKHSRSLLAFVGPFMHLH